MVECQRKVADGADFDVAGFGDGGLLDHAADSKDADFWWVDERGEVFDVVGCQVGQREGAAGKFGDAQFIRLRLSDEIADCQCKFEWRLRLGVSYHRDEQAVWDSQREAEVDGVEELDFFIGDVCVCERMVFEGLDRGCYREVLVLGSHS